MFGRAMFAKSAKQDGKGTDIADVWHLVVAYAKQETIDPIKGLGRFVVMGLAGSAFIAVGLVLLLMAMLRALQTETGTFDGRWSFAPYLLTVLVAVLLVALCVRSIGSAKRASQRKAAA